jgi:hypothetical protein
MAVAGHRFHVHLSSEEEDDEVDTPQEQVPQVASPDFIRDIRERSTPSTANAPTPPQLQGSTTGFPSHKKRSRTSAFQQRQTENQTSSSSQGNGRGRVKAGRASSDSSPPTLNVDELERSQINAENDQRLAQMSESEIERERKELMEGLSPSLLERLLKRATIDDDAPSSRNEMDMARPSTLADEKTVPQECESRSDEKIRETPPRTSLHPATDPEAAPAFPPSDLQPASNTLSRPPIHFPPAPSAPPLDPSSPDFLANLHAKYYPDLPADPSKLAWMTDRPSTEPSPYSPTNESILPSEIRFSFRGTVVAPRTALSIPVTAGLHHHGLAPEAAGYTIPELAMLARSTYPAQRCMASQTLGRILYRLGKGECGSEGDELPMGLWKVINEEKVMQTLTRAAGEVEGGRHRSAAVYATEALWLWQRGGGQKWKAQ